jgi:NADP-dependent 3-hydroxy acid dehydrogenase YdfG
VSDSGQLAWVTGASSGIGREVSLELARRGWRVIATARRAEKLEALAQEAAGLSGKILPEPGDVTDVEALRSLVERSEDAHGSIALAVLNAGDYRPMPLAEFDPDLFRHLMEVNYLGVVNAVAALLPPMTARRAGEIMINASLAGYRGLPKSAPYGATKAALNNLAESLQPELAGLDVRLRVINHGFVRSALTDQNDFEMPFLIDPERAGRRIVDAVGRRGFEVTFPIRFSLIMKLLRCLPYDLYLPLMKRLT